MASAWRLLHDAEVGIARLPGAHPLVAPLADALEAVAKGHVGISPPYHDLRKTAEALKLARIALRGAYDEQRVTVFDRDPLAIAAASSPQVMRTVARTILGPLDHAAERDRALLLDTFGAWLDADGSADRAAATLFCHPNTVRHRLRRLQDQTGRSLSQPRELAELTLAFEIDRRITDPAH
ncbi:PucR family transcriptional regulator [Streptomyces scopuliridis]|uniref:PucR family transcriptional regulator n=1 Tax=Streptomyces scopuliridis TaxID=452529 RepID=UPI00369DFB43